MVSVAKFEDIPSWTYQGKEPGIFTFFEAIALADLENKPIKLTAELQRTLLGFAVFGRREIVVLENATVKSTVDVAFGNDWESATWDAHVVRTAASAKKQLRPGTEGAKYFRYWN